MSETARQSVYRVADLLDAGQPAVQETSIAKIVCTENNFKCADIGSWLSIFHESHRHFLCLNCLKKWIWVIRRLTVADDLQLS